MAASDIFLVIIAVVGLGVGAQLLASKFRIPSVVFLIVAGLAIGPEGIGLVQRDLATDVVIPIVGTSVALIVFQDAFELSPRDLRGAHMAALKLVTVGAVVSLVGTALAVHFVLGTAWGVALLIGALVIATGPSVLIPILDVIDAPESLAAILRTEGVFNDVTAAVLAVAVFEAVTLQETEVGEFLTALVTRFGIGLAFGLATAAVVWALITYVDFSARNSIMNARLIAMTGAIVAYGSAEVLRGEAGIVAAVTAGLVLGQSDLPYTEEILEFEQDITVLLLSFVFIILTSLVEFDLLLQLGLGGVVVILLIVAVIRPLAVWVSTVGEEITRREQVFMSIVAPRGILTAGIATLFALRLQDTNPDAAAMVIGTVFLVILVTSAIEGSIARHAASVLGIEPEPTVIVGGGTFGRTLAEQYERRGERVEIVESDPDVVQVGRAEGLRVHAGDGTEPEMLRAVDGEQARRIVAVTDDDAANLTVGQFAKHDLNADTIARVNDHGNRPEFDAADVPTFPPVVSDNANADRDYDVRWLTALSHVGMIRETSAQNLDGVGRTVEDIEAHLPPRCFIGSINRYGTHIAPEASLTLERDDTVVIVGRNEAVSSGF